MRRLAAALGTLTVLAACSTGGPGMGASEPASVATVAGESPDILPIFVSSELVAGRNRFLFGLTDAERDPISAPDLEVRLELFSHEGDQGTKLADLETEFLWAIEGERGLYVAYPEFPAAGRYRVRFVATPADGEPMAVNADFDVAASGTTPAVGAPAVPSDTPTADDVDGDLSRISTDEAPDPEMYEVSVAEAVAAGEPFVLTFATPALCTTRVCGPTLEIVKSVKADYPGIRFIHVEPYDLTDTSQLRTMPWVDEWGLPSEPWVFVVDGDGRVAAKFEVVAGEDELRAAIETVTS